MRRYWMAVWWVTVWAGLCATGCFSTPEENFFDRLSDAVETLRDSQNPGDREMYSVMKMTAREKKIAKQFSDLNEDDPVAMITCNKDPSLDNPDDEGPEPSEPPVPEGEEYFPSRYTVRDTIECIANQPLVPPSMGHGFWAMRFCAELTLKHLVQIYQDRWVRSGFPNATCKMIFLPGFKSPGERSWLSRVDVSTEEIVMMLLGLQKPLAGVSLKWFTTNMVEPFPGCGLCRPQKGGDK